MLGGFYMMHRGWLDHPVLAGEFDRRSAWCWLIEHAVWKKQKVDVLGHMVMLERGQLCYSNRYLAEAWGWSDAKVRRFTTRLKTDAMIDAATDAGQTVITISNYDKYQATQDTTDALSDASCDAEATQERRRCDANKKKDKEGKEGKRVAEATLSVHAKSFDEFWLAYPPRRPHSNPKKPARQKFEAAVKRGVDPQAITDGARRYAEYTRLHTPDPKHVAQAVTWLNQERWHENHEEPNDDKSNEVLPDDRNSGPRGGRSSPHEKQLAGATAAVARLKRDQRD